MRIVLCTGNPGKLEELRCMLPGTWEVIGLADLGLRSDLPEDGDTLEANALQKARHVFSRCGMLCLADDTGLEVTALGGAPGVRSARYAGELKDARANMLKLLNEMKGADRSARFRTVIALAAADGDHCFEGEVTGHIVRAPRGEGGFGYDPVFAPEGGDLTFAEMSLEKKNTMSHRARALRKAIAFLEERYARR